jgi:hypothetical protein
MNRCVGKPGQDIREVIAYRDFESAAAFDHGEDSGYARSGLFAPDVDPVVSANCDFTDILPISVKNWKFTIAGIRFMGVRYAIEIANNAAVGVLSMWTTALAQSRWFPHGCWIPWHA